MAHVLRMQSRGDDKSASAPHKQKMTERRRIVGDKGEIRVKMRRTGDVHPCMAKQIVFLPSFANHLSVHTAVHCGAFLSNSPSPGSVSLLRS
jgi:hypothetical protein